MGMKPREVQGPQEIEQILDKLRETMEAKRDFIVLASIKLNGSDQTMIVGSNPEDFTDFLVHAMKLNDVTEAMIMSAAAQFITEKILAGLCPTCEERNECKAVKDSCLPPVGGLPEDLRKLIRKHGLSN